MTTKYPSGQLKTSIVDPQFTFFFPDYKSVDAHNLHIIFSPPRESTVRTP
jgi:hypothetical protein